MTPEQLKTFFRKCYCINLARRKDRWASFVEGFADWPLQEPERFVARDGKVLPSPPWWLCGKGAWGVFRSNLSIIEKCLMSGARSVLILEDDAVLADNFHEKLDPFLSSVPDDWEMLYLGGQYLFQKAHPPQQVNQEVVRPYNVNRCHAYALNRRGMEIAYTHLTAHRWKPRHHIDHHYGVLHQSRKIKVYAPTTWLIGQAEGKSDINAGHRPFPTRFWSKDAKFERGKQKVVAVLGPYRGGTSAVAGAMHHLGIIMGHTFFVGNKSGQGASPKGCFEAKRLFEICNTCYPEPKFIAGSPRQKRIRLLRQWLAGRADDRIVGAKHPKLCLMIPEMCKAWPECKFVVVNRPIEESARSLAGLGWWRPTWEPEALIEMLVAARDHGLSDVPGDRILHLDYSNLLANTRTVLEEIADFVEIEPSPEAYEAAMDQVDPTLRHYNK